MKKSIIKTIIFIGFALSVLGLILSPVLEERSATLIFSEYTLLVSVAAILGTTFVFTKNPTLNNIGYCLCAFVGALGVILFAIENELFVVIAAGLSVMFVGSVLQFILIVIQFFGFFKKDSANPSNSLNDISSVLVKYKELEKEKVISSEEFNELKAKTITVSDNDNLSIEDLKKWKKLLDQEVITETEFANMKAKIFKK